MRFSQRHGYTPIKNTVQIESMDDDLRSALWSVLKTCYWDTIQRSGHTLMSDYYLFNPINENLAVLFRGLWLHFFKRPLDTLPDEWREVYKETREFFFTCAWYEAYDFIEYVAQTYPDEKRNDVFSRAANTFLEREVSAYRFVDHKIVPIVAQEEMDAIEESIASSPGPVRQHLDQATRLLADRRNPDYRNSIKESISAVEAMARNAKGKDKGTLGALLQGLGFTLLSRTLSGTFMGTRLIREVSDTPSPKGAIAFPSRKPSSCWSRAPHSSTT